jgi:hypothetical protein
MPGRGDHQGGGQPVAQPLQGEGSVPRLGPLVGGHYPDLLAQPLEQAMTLTGA